MIRAQHELVQALGESLAELAPEHAPTPQFESPKQAAHGDYATNAALLLAPVVGSPPREVRASP